MMKTLYDEAQAQVRLLRTSVGQYHIINNSYGRLGSITVNAPAGGQSFRVLDERDRLDVDKLVDKLFEKLLVKPVIVACPYCSSHNAITNPTCVRCGGPMGAR